jgi:hypothetical protein
MITKSATPAVKRNTVGLILPHLPINPCMLKIDSRECEKVTFRVFANLFPVVHPA